MSEWQHLKLGDVAVLSNGTNFTKESFGSGLKIVGVRDFRDRTMPDWDAMDEVQDAALNSDRQLLAEGDLVFVRSNGNPALVGRSMLITRGPRATHSAFTIKARPNQDLVIPRFLAYQMRHAHRSGLMRAANGTNITNLSQPVLAGVPVRVPLRKTQERVLEVLGTIDDLIENNRRRVGALEEMARSIYQEWFVRFRYPGHESIPLVDSAFGVLPEGWKVRKIGDVIDLRYGKALTAGVRAGGDVAVVGSSGVVGWHDVPLIKGPSIVVGRKGNVGSVIWLDGPSWPIDTTYHVETDLPLRFVAEQLRRVEFINTHAAVPGLSREMAYSKSFLVPSGELVRRFEDAAEAFGSEVSTLLTESDRLNQLRDLLLPKLMTGQIDLSRLDPSAHLGESAA